VLVLQIMDGLDQSSEITKPDGILSILETSDGALGNSGLAREPLRGKLFRLCPDLVQIFRVNDSLVLAESFVGWVQGSRIGHHG